MFLGFLYGIDTYFLVVNTELSILERLKVTFTMEPVSPRPPIVKSKISAFLFFESSIQPWFCETRIF